MKGQTIQINGKDYKVREITIRDYYDLKNQIYMQDTESAFTVVSKLTGIGKQELGKLKYEHWLELFIAVQGNVNKSFKNENLKTETRLSIEDKVYGLVDLSNATIGEFMDLDILVSSPNLESQFHKVLAILYRPFVETEDDIVFEEYDSNRCSNRADLFLDLPISVAQQALSFFLDFARASLRHMLEFSIQEMTKEGNLTKEQANRLKRLIFESLEDGSIHSPYSQAKTFSSSTEQAGSTINSPLTISLGELINEKKRRENIMNLFKNIGLN